MKEEKDDDIIYELEGAEEAEEQVMESGHSDRCAVGAVASTACRTADDLEPEQAPAPTPDEKPTAESAPEGAPQVAPSGAAVRMTALHEELQRMVAEMGAETVLEIIRDNRNAAIRQIISEVEASRDETMASGGSGAFTCGSIFDLAALA